MWPFKRKGSGFPNPKDIVKDWFQSIDSIEKIKKITDPDELFKLCVANGKRYQCPECGGGFLEGPSGGMSVNVKCEDCGEKFNLTMIMNRLERI